MEEHIAVENGYDVLEFCPVKVSRKSMLHSFLVICLTN